MVFLNGFWEKRENGLICRWLVSWVAVDKVQSAGVIGGYSGHGAFEFERFVLLKRGQNKYDIWIDGRPVAENFLKNQPVIPEEIFEEGDLGFWGFNDYSKWEENDSLILRCDRRNSLVGGFLNQGLDTDEIRALCISVGLTAAPVLGD